MKTLKNRRKVESGRIWDAYFAACENNSVFQVEVEKGRPFGRGSYNVYYPAFEWNGKIFAVTGYDNFNGHISRYTDRFAIFGIYIAEAVEKYRPRFI